MQKPTLNQIYERILIDLTGTAHSSRRMFAKAIAGCSHLLYGYADRLSKNLHPLWAKGDTLDLWAAIWLTEGRKPSVTAKGSLTLEATDEIDLPAGTLFRFGSLEFQTTKALRFSGMKEIPVAAVIPGKIPAINSGEQLEPVQTIPSLTPVALVTEQIDGGADTETDDALRERIRERVRTPPQGGAPQDYIVWAKSVPGISRAWVAPKIEGRGTVGLCFVDDENGGLPTDTAAADLREKLNSAGPGGTDFIFVSLQPQPVNFEIRVDPSGPLTTAQIQSELRTLIKRVSEPVFADTRYWLNSRNEKTQGILTVANVHEALSLIQKDRYRVVSPASDIQTEPGKILTFGGVDVAPY